MAYRWVVVCLPAQRESQFEVALDAAMAPFQSQQGFSPGRDIWDWWAIRGGSNGLGFWTAPGHAGDPRLAHDAPTYDGRALPSRAGMCAGGPRALLDVMPPYANAEQPAGEAWDLWHQLGKDLPVAVPMSALTGRNGPRPSFRHSEDLADYWAQPQIQAFLARYGAVDAEQWLEPTIALPNPSTGEDELVESVSLFAYSREVFVHRAMYSTIPRTDVLTLDGWWVERGLTVAHADCDNAGACRHLLHAPSVNLDINQYLNGLDADVYLANLLCHT